MPTKRRLVLAAVTAVLACISSAYVTPSVANAMTSSMGSGQGRLLNFSGMQPHAEDIVRALRPLAGARTRSLSMSAVPYVRSRADDEFAPGGSAPAARPASVSFDQIEFGFNSAVIRSSAYQTLDEIGRAMRSAELSGLNFVIEGHTDARGNFAYNIKLSRRRAHAVGAYLIARHGIAPERVSFVGKGPTELIDPEHPESESNRRVVLSVQAAKPVDR